MYLPIIAMHCQHRLSMLQIKLSDTEVRSEGQTRRNPWSSSCIDLGRKLKAVTCISAPKKVVPNMLYWIWFWRLSWPFHTFETMPLKIIPNKHRSIRLHIITHQNKFITNSSGKWADIWIKDLVLISYTNQSFSMENMQVSMATKRDKYLSNHNFTISVTVSFNNTELIVSDALFPSDQQMP